MAANRNSRGLGRPSRQQLQQRKLYIVVGEGEITEKEYFALFDNQPSEYRLIYVSLKNHHGGNTNELVKEMNRQANKHSSPSSAAPTEYWIAADVERAETARDLSPLFRWVQRSPNNHLGLTNRQFENWLLLHFQRGMASERPARDLSKYIQGFSEKSKHIRGKIQLEHVLIALANAKTANVIVTDKPGGMQDISLNHTSLPRLIQNLVGND